MNYDFFDFIKNIILHKIYILLLININHMKAATITLTVILLFSLQLSSQQTSDMLEEVLGSVVTVAVYKMDESETAKILGYGTTRGDEENAEMAYAMALDLSGSLGTGSGFMVRNNGVDYIITNAHVVEKASNEEGSIFVHSINRTKYEMKLIGGDTFYDIAVLGFVTPPGPELTPVEFRKTDARIGEKVYAIGNPGGKYPYSISDGIVSAMNRMTSGITGKFGFLQSTATVIWGNSGGPLLDLNGKVVGINSQLGYIEGPDDELYIQPQINLALEADIAERIFYDILKNNGRVIRGYIGIEISEKNFTDNRAKSFMNPKHTVDSLPVLSGVIPESPAFSKLNDKIGYNLLSVNNVNVFNIDEVLRELEKIKPGQSVNLTLQKNRESLNVTVNAIELGEKELRSIAEYIIEKDDRINLQANSRPVNISLTTNHSYKYSKYENKKFNTIHGGYHAPEYIIVAAGLITKQGSTTWRISNTSDLGAAFRISGLQGVIDLRVKDANNPYSEPATLRFDLSDERYISKSALWY